jgi:hypothetical protein
MFRRLEKDVEHALGPGDRLPDIPLLTQSGAMIRLPSLVDSGYRLLYFYRRDCNGCQILESVWPYEHARGSAPRVAFIAFSSLEEATIDSGTDRFAWRQATTDSVKYLRGIPSAVLLRDDGRVVAASHTSLDHTAKLLDLIGVVAKVRVDSALTRRVNAAQILGASKR